MNTHRPRAHSSFALAAALALAIALPASAARAAPAAAATVGWEVGAATRDITPPTRVPAHDARDFAACNITVFAGPRLFDFQEPYSDTNGNGRYDLSVSASGGLQSEPYCDANANDRRDTLYSSGAVASELTTVHDPIAARAIAVRDPAGRAVLLASVTAQGLFSNNTAAIRAKVAADPRIPAGTGVVVAATHNESSPDSVGIYGAPDTGASFGATSGIDDYYTDYLVSQTAAALVAAYVDLAPGRLRAVQQRLPATISQNLSRTFPTTDDAGRGVALDPTVRFLRGERADGSGVFTVLSVAAHNQEIGHGGHPRDVSDDWPGSYAARVQQLLGGVGLFLPADIGSIEDPLTVPRVGAGEGSYEQAEATGRAFADLAVTALGDAVDLGVGPVRTARTVFDTPLENNLFKAAGAAGLFGPRPLYTGGQPTGRTGSDLRTEVALVDLGPDVQMLVWPGETFPALALGSPWGIEDASCPARLVPPVPTWRAHAAFRFQVGMGGDLLGYLEPPWAWATAAGVIADSCFTDPQTGRDPRGHKHKLESESVGPQSAYDAAIRLTALLDADSPDPLAVIRPGRYLTRAGSVTRDAAAAVAVWVAEPGATSLQPGRGTIVALAGVDRFGSTPVSAHGVPMDADGRAEPATDLQTRGFAETDASGRVLRRYYLDVYPALATTSPGAAGGDPTAAVPEAARALLLPLAGLLVAGVLLRRRRRRA